MRIYILFSCLLLSLNIATAQKTNPAKTWTDSVYKSLSPDERIAQLMIVRLSSINSKREVTFFDQQVDSLVRMYNIGGICLFQGGPVKQALLLNQLQSVAKTPLLISIDGEWGVGMRMTDSVLPLPRQMMLGAIQDESLLYEYGKIVGEQCKRLNIQVNYAPVVDVNNNPNNPVINERSFGEDKYKVARLGILYMRGMQDVGVMACAKHFPGHGDVAVDSHYDLPVINKSMEQLDSLELYPFRELIKAGIGSVMVAHLSIPAIDSAANRPTSISKNNITGLLRNKIGFQGLTFTDALEMQGVKKYFPDGESSVQAVIAGNDMLCLPGDVPTAINKIKAAIDSGKLSWTDIEMHCKKILMAKYQYGLTKLKPVAIDNLANDLNNRIGDMRRRVAENAITVLNRSNEDFFPMPAPENPASGELAYVSIGKSDDNAFARRMKKDYHADILYFNYKDDTAGLASTIDLIKSRYKKVVIGIHAYNRTPANNFGISKSAVELATQLQQETNSISFVFGNPYVIKNWCSAKNLIACYEDDSIVQHTAIDLLQGKIAAKGKLPVTVCEEYHFGSGILSSASFFPLATPGDVGMSNNSLRVIDSIAVNAIDSGAMPGCVVLVAKDGKIAYYKAYGNLNAEKTEKATKESVYDMASVTKICATTISVMKLYEQGKISLTKKLGDYLPWVRGTNKENLIIENILLHQAGLNAYIPFYRETIDTATGIPSNKLYAAQKSDSFNIHVAENLFLRKDWNDTMFSRILKSSLGPANKYVYSDNDFIFLGKLVEQLSGMPLDKYVQQEFYQPMVLSSAGFKPREHMVINKIAPTENEPIFRKQQIRGDVHDPGAAMFGGVAGHAGLFSNAYDIAVIMQMLLNGGTFNGKRYLQKETIELFTAYHSNISRRGLGFDKPEKDYDKRPEPYPCLSASPATFGHTGFTGTCTWADPVNNLVYVFLSNRVCPDGTNPKLGRMNVRPKIHEVIYKALGIAKAK